MATSTRSDDQNGSDGRNAASTFAKKLREDGRERLDSTRRAAADQIEGVADAIHAARSRLNEKQPTLALYTAHLANGIERAASRMRDSSIEDLAREARGFAQRNPALYVLGGAAIGVLLARLLKVTTEGADLPPRRAERDQAAFSGGAPVEEEAAIDAEVTTHDPYGSQRH
jgi:hypothetical protein